MKKLTKIGASALAGSLVAALLLLVNYQYQVLGNLLTKVMITCK